MQALLERGLLHRAHRNAVSSENGDAMATDCYSLSHASLRHTLICWYSLSGDDKALKSAFSAMKEPVEPNAEAPDTPVKVDLVVTESPTKDEPANAPPPSAFKRSMPTVPYSQCYTDVVSYGGVKNEAFTSISA